MITQKMVAEARKRFEEIRVTQDPDDPSNLMDYNSVNAIDDLGVLELLGIDAAVATLTGSVSKEQMEFMLGMVTGFHIGIIAGRLEAVEEVKTNE